MSLGHFSSTPSPASTQAWTTPTPTNSGSHPHWVQGLEWYKDSLIAYSLGNFVFDQEQSLKTKQGVVLSTEFSGNKLVKADLVPIQIEQYFQPHILEGSASQDVLNNIFGSSYWAN